MNNSVLKLKSDKATTLSEIEKTIEEELKQDSLYPAETVYKEIMKVNDSSILLMVFEKYYIRMGCRTSIVLQIEESGDTQSAVIIGTGGGSAVYGVNYGAYTDFVLKIEKIMHSIGFHITDRTRIAGDVYIALENM